MISSGAMRSRPSSKEMDQSLSQQENFARVVRSTGYGGTVDVRSLLKPEWRSISISGEEQRRQQALHVRPAVVAGEMGAHLVRRRGSSSGPLILIRASAAAADSAIDCPRSVCGDRGVQHYFAASGGHEAFRSGDRGGLDRTRDQSRASSSPARPSSGQDHIVAASSPALERPDEGVLIAGRCHRPAAL